mgnify:CR=1 FL=1
MKQLIVIASFFVGLNSYGQFMHIRSYGNDGFDFGRDIVEDINSNFFITGSSSSFSSSADAFIFKIDKYGTWLWSRNYGGSGIEWGESILITHDSSLAIAGYTNSIGTGGFDFYLVKTDTVSGEPFWEQTYGGESWDKCYDMVQLPDSGFVLVGETYSFNAGVRSGYIVRTDKDGDTLWTKALGDGSELYLTGVQLDEAADSIVVCGGGWNESNSSIDGFVAKFDLDGNSGWQNYYGTEYEDYFNDINHFGNFYACGGATGIADPDNHDMWLVKLNHESGAVVWEETNSSESTDQDVINAVEIKSSGAEEVYYAAGTKSYDFSLTDGESEFYFAQNQILLYFLKGNFVLRLQLLRLYILFQSS